MPPKTAFEVAADAGTENPAWTTIEGEAAYLTSFATHYDNAMTYLDEARSAGNSPLNRLTIGTNSHRGLTIAIVALQHGNEPAGREAMFTWLREVTEDAESPKVNIVVLPCLNPDGLVADARNNGNNQNLNREWFSLSQPENAYAAGVLFPLRPSFVVDLHEMISGNEQMQFGVTANQDVDNQLRGLINRLGEDAIAHMVSQGFSSAYYTSNSATPSLLQTVAALAGAVAIMPEGKRDSGDRRNRYLRNLTALRFIWQWLKDNAAEVISTTQAAMRRKTHEGLRQSRSFGMVGGTAVSPPARSYTLTAEQYDTTLPQIEAFGIRSAPITSETTRQVRCDQIRQPLIPYLLDRNSPNNVVSAARNSDLQADDRPHRITPGALA